MLTIRNRTWSCTERAVPPLYGIVLSARAIRGFPDLGVMCRLLATPPFAGFLVFASPGTFSACSFWYVAALARAGRLEEARLAFEKMLTYGNDLGLYAEQISRTGAAWELPPGIDARGADQRRVQP